MTSITSPRDLIVAGLVACALTLGACEKSAETDTHTHADGAHDHDHAHAEGDHAEHADHADHADASDTTGAPNAIYEEILGVVTALPVEGEPSSSFKIRHEHIPTFRNPKTGEVYVNRDGVLGMRSMEMPFKPAEGVDISTLKVDDKVRFTLAVWNDPVSYAVTEIETVPADTEISFEDKAAP